MNRQVDRRHHLVGGQHRLSRTGEEIGDRHATGAHPSDHVDEGTVDEQRRRRVRCRRRVADVAGERRAMANLHGADNARGLDERGKVTADALVRDQISHHDAGAHAQR